jgi:signal transduction histidine kinase
MKFFLNLNKKILAVIVLFSALTTFIGGLYTILLFQSKYLRSSRIERVIQDAQKLSSFDHSISFERALRIYEGNLSFSFFEKDCSPIHVTDMMILSRNCELRDSSFHWLETKGLSGEKYIIGFSGEFNFRNYFEDFKSVLVSTLLLYLLLILVLSFIFLHVFIDIPISTISHAIDMLLKDKTFEIDTFNVKNQTLFYSLYKKISTLIEETCRFYQDEQKLLLSRQIAHDLRAPLSILENKLSQTDQNYNIEKMAIRRLKQITDSLMNQKEKLENHSYNIENIFQELSITYSQIKFCNLSKELTPELKIEISEIELFRFLSNILKNSVEAEATSVNFSIHLQDNFLSILISDNGNGVDSNLLPEILKGKTTKSSGHGLGISYISKRLNEIGGEVILNSSPQSGFTIQLNIPCSPTSNIHFVLIDDDKLIRIGWNMKASEKLVSFQSFESIDQFMEKINTIPINSFIYIDSNLKDGIKGELGSEKIALAGFSNIYLTTGYSFSDFNLKNFPWLRGVVSKSVPF